MWLVALLLCATVAAPTWRLSNATAVQRGSLLAWAADGSWTAHSPPLCHATGSDRISVQLALAETQGESQIDVAAALVCANIDQLAMDRSSLFFAPATLQLAAQACVFGDRCYIGSPGGSDLASGNISCSQSLTLSGTLITSQLNISFTGVTMSLAAGAELSVADGQLAGDGITMASGASVTASGQVFVNCSSVQGGAFVGSSDDILVFSGRTMLNDNVSFASPPVPGGSPMRLSVGPEGVMICASGATRLAVVVVSSAHDGAARVEPMIQIMAGASLLVTLQSSMSPQLEGETVIDVAPGGTLELASGAGLEIQRGKIIVSASHLVLGEYAQLLLDPGAELDIMAAARIPGGAQSIIVLRESVLSLSNYGPSSSVEFGPSFYLNNARLQSGGNGAPRMVNFTSGLTLNFYGGVSNLNLESSHVSSTHLMLLGGEIKCQTIELKRLALYSQGNSISCPCFIGEHLGLTVPDQSQPGPYSLTFADALQFADNAELVWKTGPGVSVPLIVGGSLKLGGNVTLLISAEPQVAPQVTTVMLIHVDGGMEGDFATALLPSGWTLNQTSNSYFLWRSSSEQPLSTTWTEETTTIASVTERPGGFHLPLPVIIGAAIGGVIALAAVAALIVCIVRVRRTRNRHRFIPDNLVEDGDRTLLMSGHE